MGMFFILSLSVLFLSIRVVARSFLFGYGFWLFSSSSALSIPQQLCPHSSPKYSVFSFSIPLQLFPHVPRTLFWLLVPLPHPQQLFSSAPRSLWPLLNGASLSFPGLCPPPWLGARMLSPLILLQSQPLPSAPSLASAHLQQLAPSPPLHLWLRTLSSSCPASAGCPHHPSQTPCLRRVLGAPFSGPQQLFPGHLPLRRSQPRSPLSWAAAAVAHSLRPGLRGPLPPMPALLPPRPEALFLQLSAAVSPRAGPLRPPPASGPLPCLSVLPHASKHGCSQPGHRGWEMAWQRVDWIPHITLHYCDSTSQRWQQSCQDGLQK